MSVQQKVIQFGLTEVFTPPQPLVDVVFVHGLNGHPYNTWATHKPTEVFWPTDLLPPALEDQRCRILTYGYDAQVTAFSDGASKDKIHNHAEHLASRLVANRSLKRALERPIIFVCHSLGGLVVKRSLIHSKNVRSDKIERQRSIFVSTYGILFLGTPHNGSDIAKWGSLLERISHAVLPKKFMDSQPHLVQALKSNNETLQNINRLFIEIISRYHVYFFHESKPMDFKGSLQYIVDEDSAAPVIEGVERMGIERDHSHMCKFESEDAPGYEVVAEAIQRYAEDAPGLIRTRWEEEHRIRDLEKREAARELLRNSPSAIESLTPAESTQISQASSLGNSMGTAPPVRSLPPPPYTSSDVYEIEEVDDEQPVPVQLRRSDIVSKQESADETPAGPRVVAPLGFRPNAHFVGFKEELRKLHRRLQQERRRDIGTCSVVVWGEVGCGKTHLTRQYFYKHRSDYPAGSFWVDCRSTETIAKGVWDIGISIGALNRDSDNRTIPPGPDDFAESVRARLESMEGWLMVFDGVLLETDESFDAFRRFLPDRTGNCIIFTSVDRALVHRNRLLHPSGLKVGKLSVTDATTLLYQNLGIRQPTNLQQEKALELVKDNDYLPLAIYATAHALIERGKSLERYSHTTADQRLIRPFLEIVTGLQDQGRVEAVNLVNILCFFTHHIPVALIRFGYKGLFAPPYAIDVQSPRYGNSTRKDLESSISILLRSGLLERTLQTWTTSGSSSPEDRRSVKTAHLAQKRLPGTELTTTPNGRHPPPGGISTKRSITIRTMENTPPTTLPDDSSGLDELMLGRFESRGTRKHDYWWWLCAAVRLLVSSFATASEKMRMSSGPGLVRDYREYEAQAARLFQHFPKTSLNATAELRQARHDIRDLLKTVKHEIRGQSLSSSSELSFSRQYQGSVFEKASNSSQETQSFTTTLSPASTWSLEPERPPSESPTHMHHTQTQIEDDALGGASDPAWEDALLSDTESWPISDTTEIPRSPQSRRSSVLHAILEGKPRLKQRKDLGEFHEWKALPVPPSISQPELAFEQRNGRQSTSSDAEAALALVHKASPPPSREGGRLRSTSRGSTDRPPLAIRSPNTPLSPLAATFQPGLPASMSRPASKTQTRNPSSSPRLVQALLNSQASGRARSDLPPLQVESIHATHSQVQLPHRSSLRVSPGTAARDATQLRVPTGYQSVPMSRDASRESEPSQSVATSSHASAMAPHRAFSDPHVLGFDPPSNFGFTGVPLGHPDSLDFGRVEEWANLPPVQPEMYNQTFQGLSINENIHYAASSREPLRPGASVQFGSMDPLSIGDARARASLAREASNERARGRSRGSQSRHSRGHGSQDSSHSGGSGL
ncbi:Protein SERAC1 [Cyphellophora attinorum]|uniref:Protein SERAC1 n=1 Tax=Cyphellophora attinorum TaxID=1664694 RepID=A0A0N1NWU9_9EURO|nr:Protein SERAC1 [Phialophora attinorum]KPI37380.1 Protein SERAC1 [Phialophora attinorum]